MRVRRGKGALARGPAARRLAQRRRSAGFTLIELMVVVFLIAILAMLAVPNMLVAREDRFAFRSADQMARIIHEGRTRAMARGAAQLVVLSGNAAVDRGTAIVFESVDATNHPVSACKTTNEWAGVPAGSATNVIVAGHNLNNASATALQNLAGLETAITVGGVATPVVIVCFTPGGRVYVVPGADIAAALLALPTAAPFTSNLNLAVTRRPGGGAANGLTRNVIMTAAGGTRIRSL